jgi:hypothetical protein
LKSSGGEVQCQRSPVSEKSSVREVQWQRSPVAAGL